MKCSVLCEWQVTGAAVVVVIIIFVVVVPLLLQLFLLRTHYMHTFGRGPTRAHLVCVSVLYEI